jgi:hypothetical protein
LSQSLSKTVARISAGLLIRLAPYYGEIYPYDGYFWLPIYIGGSFFLFCNVFRIGNKLEPYWYITFLVITLALIQKPALYWPVMLGICEPLKFGLIVYRIRQPNYVGIFSRAPDPSVEDPYP